jgi:hypothetical protein
MGRTRVRQLWIFLAINFWVLTFTFSESIFGATSDPFRDYAAHHVGKLVLTVTNDGWMGASPRRPDTLAYSEYSGNIHEYPKNSSLSMFQFIAPWVGAVVKGDTNVSGWTYWNAEEEFNPDGYPQGQMRFRSISTPVGTLDENAISEEDWIATYYDTVRDIEPLLNFTGSKFPHRPLQIMITQDSHSWSYSYIEDVVMIRFRIRNIGRNVLKSTFIGLSIEPSARFLPNFGSANHVCGFLKIHPVSVRGSACLHPDTLNIAWIANDDGDPVDGQWQSYPVQVGDYDVKSNRSISGICVLNSHDLQTSLGGSDARLSFNWYSLSEDFGPRLVGENRYFDNGYVDVPLKDQNMYYLMSNGEIDYPSVYTAITSQYGLVWQYPDQTKAISVAKGTVLSAVLSVGPVDLYPGDEIEIPYAIVAGENFHLYPNNGDNLPYNPRQWMENVDFSDLAKNALWAQWVYDNPGIDSDGDGYRGEYHICVTDSVFINGQWTVAKADTTYYRGDGVPDWKGAQAPPAPKVWLEPLLNGVKVRWNGARSETEKDPFLQAVDFEGYHVYFGRDNREASLQLIGQYDRENFDKHVFVPVPNDSGLWETTFEVQNIPFTLEQLRCLYGTSCYDSSFDPETYTITNTYRHPNFSDSIFFFTKHNFNTSRLGVDTDIKKTFPNTRDPSIVHPDSLTADDYTADSLLKFYEYEMVIPNLLPSVSYFVSVTSFDFGSPPSGLQALETSKMDDIQIVYPYINPGDEDESNRKVYVYPNPYRFDGNYRSQGLESHGRDNDFVDRVRQVHFNNLPHKCTIRMFTLDGDLIREIDHDKPPDDPTSHHDTFSLINRNGMLIVTGLYYWTVESPDGKVQIGKLAVIQ